MKTEIKFPINFSGNSTITHVDNIKLEKPIIITSTANIVGKLTIKEE